MKWMRHPHHGILPAEDFSRVEALKKCGWEEFDMPTKASKAEPPVPVIEEDHNDIESLFADAIKIGIKIDRRWGIDRLKREIDAALGS